MKNRLTNYNFWISLVSAALLIVQALGIEFEIAYINEIATAVLGLLVVIGIISDPTKSSTKQQTTSTETEKTEENKSVTPCDEENEIIDDNLKNDFEGVVNQISKDLETKFNELETLKQEIQKNFEDNIQLVANSINLSNGDEESSDVLNITTIENEIKDNIQENSFNEENQVSDNEKDIEETTSELSEYMKSEIYKNTIDEIIQPANDIEIINSEVLDIKESDDEISNASFEESEVNRQNEDVVLNEQIVQLNSTSIETNEKEIENQTSFPIVGE